METLLDKGVELLAALVLFVLSCLWWEVRNLRVNHLNTIFSKLNELEIRLTRVETLLERMNGDGRNS